MNQTPEQLAYNLMAAVHKSDCTPECCEVAAKAAAFIRQHSQQVADTTLTKERAAWIADKIHALGDYAKEAAYFLNNWPDGAAKLSKTQDVAQVLVNALYECKAQCDEDLEYLADEALSNAAELNITPKVQG